MLPIQKQIRALKDQKEPQEESNSGIIEIDELLAYMHARQAKPDEESKMPPGMEELFFDLQDGWNTDSDGADGTPVLY